MKKYLGVFITVMIIAVLVFVLSNTAFESVDMLMRPPKNEGQNSEIQAAFEASINDKYILRSPLSGEYKSSFILVDFDGDKKDEVVVFYSLSGTPDVARMNILCNRNGGWKSIVDIESAHKQIHKVDFSDVDKDGVREILVGWSISDINLSNTLNVYKIKSDGESQYIEKVFENIYTEFIVCDVNSDFKNDILLFDKYHSENALIRVTYFDFVADKAYPVGDYFIDSTISSVYSVNFDTDKNNGNTRFYVDGYRFDSGMTTELFYWDNKEDCFVRPEYDDSKSISAVATRSTVITCRDINDDGVIEIPFEEFIDESEVVLREKSLQKRQNIIKWVKYNPYGFSPVYYEIFNTKNYYSLKIKNDWVGDFTVKSEPEKGLMTFYRVEGSVGSFNDSDNDADLFDFAFDDSDTDGNSLFSILCISENDSDFYNLSGYKYLKTDNGFSYFCYIYKEGKKSGITKDSLKKILVT